jgi:hypothetical protein
LEAVKSSYEEIDSLGRSGHAKDIALLQQAIAQLKSDLAKREAVHREDVVSLKFNLKKQRNQY